MVARPRASKGRRQARARRHPQPADFDARPREHASGPVRHRAMKTIGFLFIVSTRSHPVAARASNRRRCLKKLACCAVVARQRGEARRHELAPDGYLHVPAGRFRREADIADRGSPRRTWADSGLLGVAWEGSESAAKPPFHCERQIGIIALSRRPRREPAYT